MAEYTPKTWQCGETITAEDLNHLEQGVANAGGGNAPLIVSFIQREATVEECASGGEVIEFSHSWQEVRDALVQGRQVLMVTDEGGITSQTFAWAAVHEDDNYRVALVQCELENNLAHIVTDTLSFPDANNKVMMVNCGQQH